MKKSRFTEEEIIAILMEHHAGISVADLCGKHGVNNATVYKWRSQYGGIPENRLDTGNAKYFI